MTDEETEADPQETEADPQDDAASDDGGATEDAGYEAPEEGEVPPDAYPDEYAEPEQEPLPTHDPYGAPDPAAAGWIPLEEDEPAPRSSAGHAAPPATTGAAGAPAAFPLVGMVLGLLAFSAIAYARLDTLAAGIDLAALTRSDIRGIVYEFGLLLFGGTMLMTGATAGRLGGGAKAALFIVGALVLLGVPQNLL